ncbi:flagellar hook-length control protein FliK [Gymnodinialimonas ceratoperidinii]|uniref:Flagellar hook-length control protein FliK n=1 Tax=Gymnodinialimonas ceratoperidinii TaxID=2856823 RepID=A0A8F6TXS2_9RHOB|nr:flagellar hook-length control protein FliK [Gymnodinialimonas ceratoperidinii]QXT39873.1 flagellar hook-length control protein FliK [Gymnodinialimonas ceratoperidinii]
MASTGFTTVAAPPSRPQALTAIQDDAPPRDAPVTRVGGWTVPAATAPSPYAIAPMLPTPASVSAPPLALQNLTDVAGDALPDLDANLQTLLGTASSTALTAPGTVLAQASTATAQVVAQQLAAALSAGSIDADSPLELALDPPELGRVRMMMSEVAGVMTLTIHAERPETADLMRRHLDLLAQEFAEAGLDSPSVHISQDGADTPDGRDQDDPFAAPVTTEAAAADDARSHPRESTADGGLDLRL